MAVHQSYSLDGQPAAKLDSCGRLSHRRRRCSVSWIKVDSSVFGSLSFASFRHTVSGHNVSCPKKLRFVESQHLKRNPVYHFHGDSISMTRILELWLADGWFMYPVQISVEILFTSVSTIPEGGRRSHSNSYMSGKRESLDLSQQPAFRNLQDEVALMRSI